MEEGPARLVRLALVDGNGALAGVLPAYEVETPWWEDVEPVVVGAREVHGTDVVVLRLLEADRRGPPGGTVTYAAEVRGDVPVGDLPILEAPTGDERARLEAALLDHPRRATWARPGGARADLDWADAALEGLGTPRTEPAQQMRSWNLSSLWRLPTEDGAAWLKVVPAFFAHEGRLLERLGGGPVPRVLARDGARSLLAEVPGDDLHGADVSLLSPMADLLLGLQRAWVGRADELLALGAADARAPALSRSIEDVVRRTADALPAEDREALAGFVSGLAERFRRIAECGIPDTLVHGDFQPGNVRGHEGEMVVLDWGDSAVGHPLLDLPTFLASVEPSAARSIGRRWLAAWETAFPGADAERAYALLAPVAAARLASVYRGFLDRIEPSEHPYHRDDPARWLERVAAVVRAE
jgi:hypothetical protein